MNLKITNIEECLLVLVGFVKAPAIDIFSIKREDGTVLHSIARQVSKGTALTDRQYELLQRKLIEYEQQFIEAGYDIKSSIKNLKIPLRQIDRSKYIKIVSTQDVYDNTPYEAYKEKWQWIKIRFPFSKKDIMLINDILKKNDDTYSHKKGTHEHYFVLNEYFVFELVNRFIGKENFEIDDTLIQLYEEIKIMKDNPQEYVPGIYGLKLKNLQQSAIDYMINDLGEPTVDNLYLFKDKEYDYGLEHFDEQDLQESIKNLTHLSKRILNRSHRHIFVDNKEANVNRLIESLLELNRFPVLFVLDSEDCHSTLPAIHESVRNIFYQDDMTCLFRLDNKDSFTSSFNTYVKENNINSPLDKTTKIVYINDTDIKKTIFKVGWQPRTVVMMGSKRANLQLQTYLESIDLVIHFDEQPSAFSRIEKI